MYLGEKPTNSSLGFFQKAEKIKQITGAE